MNITLQDVKNHPAFTTYIQRADEYLTQMGYTEHAFVHVGRVANEAARILLQTGHDKRKAELAAIAGYLHDIGNIVNREGHEQSGAMMVFCLLTQMGANPDDIATIVTAIGNHDEGSASPVSEVSAALILADKSDVRRSRVRNRETIDFDIHDRVNYAVEDTRIVILDAEKEIQLQLRIDQEVSSISEYFEIFLSRMLLCRRAASKLGHDFALLINGQKMM
ncbi:MAG: HD domain-containing protein [Clostridiales bacterium]|nr:HD domain-containing protein [Clostridiales bacterium]